MCNRNVIMDTRLKMKLFIFLTTMIPLLGSASAICHACLDQRCFTKRKIFEAEELSGQIAIDRNDNLLHLHYKDYKDTDHTVIVDLNYDTVKMEELPIRFSFARAVNQNTGEVYFSGNRGIYVYNTVTKQTESFGLFKKQIGHMQFVDNKLYYSEYNDKGLYYIENNKTNCIDKLSDYVITDFVVDKLGDIYFVSEFLVYRLKKDDVRAQLFSSVTYALSTDIYGNVYFVETFARMLYTLDYSTYTPVEVGILEVGSEAFRIVFDKSNRIIYADTHDDKVYLLAPNYSICNVVKIKEKKHKTRIVE